MNTIKRHITTVVVLITMISILIASGIAIDHNAHNYNITQQDIISSSIIMFLMILICVLSGCLVIYASKVIKSN